jgi:16S rRNA (guanine527-N7)-methyltransferase
MQLKSADVSRETIDKLDLYFRLLKKWQKSINLVSNSTLSSGWERHFEDSAQLLPFIDENVKYIYDIGSGAGFPGLVLAIARPDIEVHCIESDGRKCSFLRTVARETGVSVKIHTERVESVASELPAPDLITARALASVEKLADLCSPWVLASGESGGKASKMLLLKGRGAEQEIDQAKNMYDFNTKLERSVTDHEAHILILSEFMRKV